MRSRYTRESTNPASVVIKLALSILKEGNFHGLTQATSYAASSIQRSLPLLSYLLNNHFVLKWEFQFCLEFCSTLAAVKKETNHWWPPVAFSLRCWGARAHPRRHLDSSRADPARHQHRCPTRSMRSSPMWRGVPAPGWYSGCPGSSSTSCCSTNCPPSSPGTSRTARSHWNQPYSQSLANYASSAFKLRPGRVRPLETLPILMRLTLDTINATARATWDPLETRVVKSFVGIIDAPSLQWCTRKCSVCQMQRFWGEHDLQLPSRGCSSAASLETLLMKIGTVLLILSELMLFVSFFWTYFDSSVKPNIEIRTVWPSENIIPVNSCNSPLLNSILLISSGFTITF